MNDRLGDVLQWLHESWPSWFGGEAVSLRPAVLEGSSPYQRRLLLFVFVGQETSPRVFLKLGLEAVDRPHIKREFNTVQTLHQAGAGESAVRLPSPYGLYDDCPMTAAAYGVLEGRRLLVPPLMGRTPVIGKRSMARFWRETSSLGLGISQLRPSDKEVDERWLGERVDRFRARYASGKEQHATLRAFQRALEQTRAPLELSWQHGDMAVGNVLVRRDGLCLVDWEAAGNDYEPWFDLTTAPAASVILGARQFGASVEDAAQIILSDARWTGRLMMEAITELWSYDLPIGWGIALSTMRRALRRLERGGVRAVPYARIALAMVMDPQLRARAPWATPIW